MADIVNSVNDDTNTVNVNTNTDNPVNHNADSDVDNSSIDKSVDSNSSIVDSDDIGCNIDNKDTGKCDSTDSNINNIHSDTNIDKPSSKNTKYDGRANLIPFNRLTEEEQKELASKAGKASGEARRKKKDLREIAKALLAANMNDEQVEEILGTAKDLLGGDKSVGAVLTARMAQEAGKGNYKAYEVLRDTAGYKPKDQMEIETITDGDRALMENLAKRLKPV